MKKILLTGSTGFIGSELLKNLSKNYKIYVTLRKKTKKNFIHKNIIKIYFSSFQNLNDKIEKLKINTVIHCATHYVKKHDFKDIKKLSDSNILFGNIILENLEKMGVKTFINFSTVWENFNGKKDNYYNLYSAYKSSFKNIINFYKKKFSKIKFINLVISDTFGENDKRKKIINLLKINYKKRVITKLISKNLYMNLLNVIDINNAVRLILKKNYKSGTYLLKNESDFKVSDIIDGINKHSNKRIKIRWLSNNIIKEKTFKFKTLKNWKSNNSEIKDIVRIITK
ncbi:NAD-dependent epimerase/dehydratase family protein [Candidatus Pelagibacter sp.]|nr:NAD-dependent epimerase/dehydratase family protein [Candidatus Pelagibacter sp.]